MLEEKTHGDLTIKFNTGSGRFTAHVIKDGKIVDTLSHPSIDGLHAKVYRYLKGEVLLEENKTLKADVKKLGKQVADLSDSLSRAGQSNAKVVELEAEVKRLGEENEKLGKQVADSKK